MTRSLAVVALACAVIVPAAAAASPKGFTAIATQTTGKQPGKSLTFSEVPRTGSKVVGHDRVSCTHMGKTSMQCTASFVLTGGTLVVAGKVVYANKANTLAIVCGTGLYKGARGILTIRDQSSTKTVQTFAFS